MWRRYVEVAWIDRCRLKLWMFHQPHRMAVRLILRELELAARFCERTIKFVPNRYHNLLISLAAPIW